MANPFLVAPANPLQALMMGQQGYNQGRKYVQDNALSRAGQLYAAGDIKGAQQAAAEGGSLQALMGFAGLQNSDRDFAFRQDEAKRAQGNTDISQDLQERQIAATAGQNAAQLALAKAQFEESKRQFGVNQEGQRVPPGFQPDPTTPGGLRPVMNGPADPAYMKRVADAKNDEKALPAELAARVALGGKFLDEAPLIRAKIDAGDLNGFYNKAAGYTNSQGAGELQRKIKSGTDALLRSLTGAGMPAEEARKYVSRYEPQVLDQKESLLSKFDQLRDELNRAESEAYRGRGGIPKAAAERRQIIQDANDAIARGADRKKVMQELRSKYGVNFGDF